MGWILWLLLFAAAAADLVLLVLLLRMRDKMQKQQRTDHKALKREKQELTAIRRELCHERDIIGLIQEHMVEGILILDDSDKIQLANRTAVAQLRIADGEWENKSIFILTDNQDFLQALRQSKTGQNPPVRHLLKLEEKYIRAYIHRVEMGGIFGTIVLLVDVTYSVKAEKMRQEFTANVSHELKTPLTTIKGFGEMFGSGMITRKEDVLKYGSMIERESERLLFLINDIIRLSEIEEHTEELRTPVELRTAAQDALQILEARVQQNDIHVELKGDCLILNSNDGYMRELFINLIDNAIKYNNPGGMVRVSIEKLEHQAKIVVADNGIGIPINAQSRIFERFYRVDKSRSKQRGGTGLGLSIVKHIVDCHNGTISLRSELGKGTEITILLPLQ